MNNKILVNVFVPVIEKNYEVFIPVNRKIGTVKKIITDTIINSSDNELKIGELLKMYDSDTGDVLENNMYIKDSKIRNGTKLVLI